MLIVVAGETMASSTSVMSTNSVEVFDLSTPGTAWVSTTNFPFFISGSRAVTLDNVLYVTGRSVRLHQVLSYSVLHSHWSRNVESWLSLVERIIVLG